MARTIGQDHSTAVKAVQRLKAKDPGMFAKAE
jgi:hypothetical protein